eukprot:7019311-Alexandrium_andersonii.AAC.1
MSASLVGSEMCIRDSSLPALAADPAIEVWACRDLERRWAVRSLSRAPAVSYTHLTLPTICSV